MTNVIGIKNAKPIDGEVDPFRAVCIAAFIEGYDYAKSHDIEIATAYWSFGDVGAYGTDGYAVDNTKDISSRMALVTALIYIHRSMGQIDLNALDPNPDGCPR